MHVLLIEDDALVAGGIVSGLGLLGFAVEHVVCARDAQTVLATCHFDSVILDLGLPDEDGMTLLARLRRDGNGLPILLLTARDAVEDRVAGLEAGADDYLLKPFDLSELAARLHALQRRAAGRCTNRVQHGRLCFNPANQTVTLAGMPVDLSRRELTLLQTFLNHPGRVLNPEQVKDHLYGLGDTVESNAVSVHIHHLRRKLGSRIIETVRGVGYRLGPAES